MRLLHIAEQLSCECALGLPVCVCVCVHSLWCLFCVRLSEELLNRGGCEVCVCAETEELRSQVSRLQSRNRELELQSSGRNNDHARQIRQVTHTHTHKTNNCSVE